MIRQGLLNSSALCSAALLACTLATAAPAFAQDEAPPQGTTAADSDEGQEVIVTGSRIRRPDFSAPNPVTSVDEENIQQSGQTSLVEYLQGIPALTGSLDGGQTTATDGFVGSTGIDLLNLRNLGVERTLVLVDGRRHVASLPETAAVDVATIPVGLIERVDVVTGGTGAIYGADAVSGVVNFVMKKDFEGIVANARNGISTYGDANDWHISIAAGKNFAGGRGNISAAFEVSHQGRLRSDDRSYLRSGRYRTMQRNPNDPLDDPNLPDNIPLRDVRFNDSGRGGGIDVNFDGFPDFLPNGDPWDPGMVIEPGYSVGGSGTSRADYIGDIRARSKRYLGNLFLNYEFSDAVRFFGEAKYVRSRAFSKGQPTFDYLIGILPDNAFLPDSIVAPFGALVNRDNFDLGVRAEDNTRNTWRTVAGINGNLSETIRYELSYVWGQTKVKNVAINNRLDDRFFAAIDAVDDGSGNIVCRSTLLGGAGLTDQPFLNFGNQPFFYGAYPNLSFTPGAGSGCIPLNIFGEGVADPAAIDWVMTDSIARSKLSQQVLSGFVTGTVPGFSLPGGDIGFVVGGEWRREASRSTPAIEDQAGISYGNQVDPSSGHFSVKEAFGEIRLPVLKDVPFAEILEFNGAARVSHYTTVGTTTTWNVSGIWAPVRDLRFRSTYARAVRAPNISELFGGAAQTFQTIVDPCDEDELANGASTRAANCATLLSGLGVADPANFQDLNTFRVAGAQRGNDDLSEETAKSWTIGAVIQPRFIPRLSVSLDWYNIKIKDAIIQASAEEIAENCVDAANINNQFCDLITRSTNPINLGAINGFTLQPFNVASITTAGLDFNVAYRLDPSDLGIGSNLGAVDFRLYGNYLDKLEFIPAPGAEAIDHRGERFAPKWQVTFDMTWHLDPVTINYGFNYFSKTKRFENSVVDGNPDIASKENIYFDARHTHDIYVSYDVDRRFKLYMGVNNVLNQKPDLETYYPVSPVGRFFYAGVRLGFDNPF